MNAWIALVPVRRRLGVPRWAIVVVLLWLLMVGAYVVLSHGREAPLLCLFRAVTGVPCATCGSTRAALAVMDGRVLDALRLNPLVCALVAAGAAWMVVRLGFARRVELSRGARRAMWAGVCVLFVVNWIWVVFSR